MFRVAFTEEDDALLMKYIAIYNPQHKGRLGIKLYERLVENAERKWSFSSRHSVQSWRERYKNNQPRFDTQILKYQKKHNISANDSYNISSQATVHNSDEKSPPAASRSRSNNPSRSTPLVGESRAKKRLREVDSKKTDLESRVAKKDREMDSVQGSQLRGSSPHSGFLSVELPNEEKTHAKIPLFLCSDEDEAALAIGPDDYTGALSGSGESDQEVESRSEVKGISASAMPLSPSIPTNKDDWKLSVALRKLPSPSIIGTTTAPEELSSHQPLDHRARAIIAKVPQSERNSVAAPLQLSQEPTPPHTSTINSPRSPLSRQPSPTNGALSRPEHCPQSMPSDSPKQRRMLSSRKRTTASRDEDDFFNTPSPQAARANLAPQIRWRKVPRLVEGPFRSVYVNADGEQYFGCIQPKVVARDAIHNPLLFPAASAHELPPPVPGPPSKRASLGQNPNPSIHNDPSVNDPFTVPPINQETRRRTLVGDNDLARADTFEDGLFRRASVQHIDLRALHSGKGVGTSGSSRSLGRSNSSDSTSVTKNRPRRSPRLSTQSNLSQSNKELVLALGLEAVYSRMAENHKFHIDVVREVAAKQRSLEDTDRMLRNMREAAAREYTRMKREEAICSNVENESEGSEEELAKPGDDKDNIQPVQPSQASRSNHSLTSPSLQGRTRRVALKIAAESPDSSPIRSPHYSPPTPTRAHEFRRLERQGRVEEARLREANRVCRSLQFNSAETSPEVEEHEITAYLLQLPEGDMNGAPPEKSQDVHGPNRREEDKGHGSPITKEYAVKTTSSLACSAPAALSFLDSEWTNSDDELLLDGDLAAHKELVKRKGLGSVKFRTAHLYGLLLD